MISDPMFTWILNIWFPVSAIAAISVNISCGRPPIFCYQKHVRNDKESSFHLYSVITRSFSTIYCLQVTYVSPSLISCITPAHAAGEVDFVVTSSGGQQFTPVRFNYSTEHTPTISSVSPSQGFSGQDITIAGTAWRIKCLCGQRCLCSVFLQLLQSFVKMSLMTHIIDYCQISHLH